MGHKTELLEDRLWKHVKLNANDKGCHIWEGSVDASGTGRIARSAVNGGKLVAVHRLAFELVRGPIPDKHRVVQVCGESLCVRDDHLDVQPYPNAQKEACPQGHPYDEANTYWYRGGRSCRTCRGMKPAAQA